MKEISSYLLLTPYDLNSINTYIDKGELIDA